MYLDSHGQPTKDSDIGYRASGVPGTVRGLELAHRKYGRSAWGELLQPAVKLASKGFVISVGLAEQFKASQNRLGAFVDSRRIFLRHGRLYRTGEILKQPELAVTLRRLLKDGANDFYEGTIAHLIAADMQAHGGMVSLEDLKNYRPIERSPLVGLYRGYTILTAPPPSSGGIGILQMLGMLESTGFEKAGAGSPVAIHYMTEAMRRFFADRSRYLGDPEFSSVPVSSLLDPKYIAMRRKSMAPGQATPGDEISPGTFMPAIYESSQTTHYSIVDQDGNAVAVTYTLNGNFGSGVTAKGTGILLNNEMDDFSAKPGSPNTGQMSYQGDANLIQPHKTPLSSMSPTIVLRDGRLFAVLGSPGGPTIINTVLEVLVNLIDFHMNIAQAVDAPRFHHQWMPDSLQVEPGFSPDTIERLKGFGHKIEQISRQGEVAAIVSEGGSLQGAADPRTEGKAVGY
jgi:gamma-glutamyltranspeptidase/glutathione hydrolase